MGWGEVRCSRRGGDVAGWVGRMLLSSRGSIEAAAAAAAAMMMEMAMPIVILCDAMWRIEVVLSIVISVMSTC